MSVLLLHIKLQKFMVSVWLQWKGHPICRIRHFEREINHFHTPFVTVYCYNCSIFLLISYSGYFWTEGKRCLKQVARFCFLTWMVVYKIVLVQFHSAMNLLLCFPVTVFDVNKNIYKRNKE